MAAAVQENKRPPQAVR